MRFFVFIAALSTILVSCQKNVSTISGALLGADGKPMPLAHVHLAGALHDQSSQLDDPVLLSQQVREDGTFEISTFDTGPFTLLCTGVGHHELRIPLPLEYHSDLSLDIRLAFALPDTSLPTIGILTTVDRASKRSDNLVKQADGSFRADIAALGDSLWYMIFSSNGDSWATTAIGASAQRYETAPSAQYFAVVPVVDGRARIEYRLPSQAVPAPAAYQFRDASCAVAEFARMRSTFMDHVKASELSLQNHMRSGLPLRSFAFPWMEFADTLARTAATTRDRLLKDELTLELLECYQRVHMPVNNTERQELIAGVSPTSLAWVYHGSLGTATQKIPDMGQRYFASLVDRHPWRNYSAYLLYSRCVAAKQARADSAVTAVLARLVRDFEDTPGAVCAEYSFAPANSLQVGSSLPEFAFRSADDSSMVFTNATFRGQHLLVVFWATWCAPCVAEIPDLQRTYEKYGNAGLKILSVSLGNDGGEIARFRKARWPMPWSVALVPKNRAPYISKGFAAGSHILVDPEGKILLIDSLLTGSQCDSTLARVLSANVALVR
jgi:thiol-disulfide isomerase/thioredoxin